MFYKIIDMTLGKTLFPVLDFYFNGVIPEVINRSKDYPPVMNVIMFLCYAVSPVFIVWVYKYGESSEEAISPYGPKTDYKPPVEVKKDLTKERRIYREAKTKLSAILRKPATGQLCYERVWDDSDYPEFGLTQTIWKSEWEQIPDLVLYMDGDGVTVVRLYYLDSVPASNRFLCQTYQLINENQSALSAYMLRVLDGFVSMKNKGLYRSGEAAKDEF